MAAASPIGWLGGTIQYCIKPLHEKVTSKRFPVDASDVVEGRAKPGRHTGAINQSVFFCSRSRTGRPSNVDSGAGFPIRDVRGD